MLRFYACLCFHNKVVATQMLSTKHDGIDLKHIILRLLGRDKPLATRMLASKWLVSFKPSMTPVSVDCISFMLYY